MAYSPKQAAQLANLSVSGIKNIVGRYPEHFSATANPGPNIPRQFTARDVAVLRLVAALSKQNVPTAEIAARLESGETGDMPTDGPQEATEAPQQAAQLVLVRDAMTALQQRLDDSQRREDALHDRIAELERELGQAQGELSQRRLSFWRRLFGG